MIQGNNSNPDFVQVTSRTPTPKGFDKTSSPKRDLPPEFDPNSIAAIRANIMGERFRYTPREGEAIGAERPAGNGSAPWTAAEYALHLYPQGSRAPTG